MTATVFRRCLTVTRCAGLAAVFVACEKHAPTRPSQLVPRPLVPVLARLELSGPRTIAPDLDGTYRALARYSDGTSRDVTTEAQWHSSSADVASIEAPGQMRGHLRGETVLTVQFERITSAMQIVIVPEGTFRLSGVVRMANSAAAIIAGARVEALGVPERLETVSDNAGRYALFGVPADARIRVSRPEYQTEERSMRLTDHQSVDFTLTPSQPLPDLSGSYTLRITRATPCGAADPGPEFRDRTYSAAITQTSTTLRVDLGGADLVGGANRFLGSVEPSGATFVLTINQAYYDFADLIERLSRDVFLVIGGSAATRKVPEGLVGTMNATMAFYRAFPVFAAPFTLCSSTDTRFALLK